MNSRDGILRERIDHACAMIEVLENASEGLDARAVVLEAEVREIEERLLLCEPGDELASELLSEWEHRWRDLAEMANGVTASGLAHAYLRSADDFFVWLERRAAKFN